MKTLNMHGLGLLLRLAHAECSLEASIRALRTAHEAELARPEPMSESASEVLLLISNLEAILLDLRRRKNAIAGTD